MFVTLYFNPLLFKPLKSKQTDLEDKFKASCIGRSSLLTASKYKDKYLEDNSKAFNLLIKYVLVD
jgi:hypothetical protein